MLQIIYRSESIRLLTDRELKDLLVQSRERNNQLGITGMLLCLEGNFKQVLEGDEKAVRQVYASIVKDKRHRNIQLMSEKIISQRHFPDWCMGFKKVDPDDKTELEGFVEFPLQPKKAF